MLFQTDVSGEKGAARLDRVSRVAPLFLSIKILKARTSMVDGFPYKEEVGGSSPSVPTMN